MREILFKGKLIDQDEWIEGDLILHGEDAMIFAVRDFPYGTGMFSVDPKTVGQYIGFDDKNRKKIFEGDKLEVIRNKMKWICIVEDIRSLPSTMFGSAVESIEIIGNVYDDMEK